MRLRVLTLALASWPLAWLLPRRLLLLAPLPAQAAVELRPEAPKVLGRRDEDFARGMAYGMVDYERAVQQRKRQLFQRLLKLLPAEPVLVEVGIGSFPNALYLAKAQGMDIVGVDPNEYMPLGSERGFERAMRSRGRATRARTPRGPACWSLPDTTSCGCCGASLSDCLWRIRSQMRRTGPRGWTGNCGACRK